MYWGSRYCAGCKYNRDCYMLNSNMYGYGNNKNQCIIVRKAFEEIYRKENKE